mgnify:CR=1 FL=1
MTCIGPAGVHLQAQAAQACVGLGVQLGKQALDDFVVCSTDGIDLDAEGREVRKPAGAASSCVCVGGGLRR